jgi:hypothetical protein
VIETHTPLDRRAAALGLVTVVAANFLYLAGLPLVLDPVVSMDAFYIAMAQRPIASILAENPAWGPLYAVWLKPFVAVLGDPVTVYVANVYALSVGVSVLIYLYLLLLTRRPAAGVGAALFFLISDLNVPLSSKVSGFALMLVLAGLSISELFPAGARRMSAAMAGVLLASYARPELYPAALCLGVAAAWLARKESRESGGRVLLWPASTAAAVLILALSTGTPLFSPQHTNDRLVIAFREHFAWNWSTWHHQARNFFAVWEAEFSGAQSVLGAFRTNPGAVMHHLADNLLGSVTVMIGTAFNHYPLLAPVTHPNLVTAESLLVSAAVLGSLICVAGNRRWRRQLFAGDRDAPFAYAVVAAFSFASATVIYPLPHYLVIPGVLLMLVGTLAISLIIPAATDLSWRNQVLAALVCLAAVPRPFVLPSAYVVRGSPFKGRITVARTVTDTISFVRSLNLSAPVHVLTVTDGIGEMLGPGFHEVKGWLKGEQPLQTYMQENDIAVVINLEGGRDSFVLNDPYWPLFQNEPQAAGFTRLAVPDHALVGVYVRSDLLQRQGDSP